jgi:Copper type II ascorbate-dependent monooxygenase, C-terminal domain./Redoxin.
MTRPGSKEKGGARRQVAWLVAPAVMLTTLLTPYLVPTVRAAAPPSYAVVTDVAKGGTARRSLSDVGGKRATVVVFASTACPITNTFAPELRALSKAYAAKGVRLVLAYANAEVTAAEAAAHAREFGLARDAAILIDADQRLMASLGATITPEAFLLDPHGKVRYQGRIDDRYIERGKARGTGPSKRDLRAALDAVLAGKPVKVTKTAAVGCVIEKRAATVAAYTGPTYAGEVAAILNQNCVSCHRSGEVGPMPLDTYEAARRYAANIASVTGAKLMPPWKPVDDHGTFVGERRLTQAQVGALKAWADAGAPQGDPARTPPAPNFPRGWRLGEPDLVLTMPEEWTVPASGDDLYRCFVLPTGLTADQEVVAVEYRAGNTSVVHHVLGFVDTKGQARAKDAADPGPGYTSFGGPGFTPVGEVGGWAPGNLAQFLPDGIGRRLPAGSDIVIQVHYHPTGKVEKDRTSIGLYFAKKPITKQFRVLPVAVRRLEIPAGEKAHQVSQTFPVPIDADIINVAPHMHLLGKTFEMTAKLPDGTEKTIVRIRDWDFNWQDTYTFKEPMRLPKGSLITLTATFDNSAENPRNPNAPPKTVTWGEATTDEMCIGFIGFVAVDENEPLLKLLDRALAQGSTPQPFRRLAARRGE